MSNTLIKPILSSDRYNIFDMKISDVCTSKSTGELLIFDGQELVPLLSPIGTLLDIINMNEVILTHQSVKDYLEFLGFDDLINSFVIDDKIISIKGNRLYYGIVGDSTKTVILGNEVRSDIDELITSLDSLDDICTEMMTYYPSDMDILFDEVTNYGDISDYISVKTLVRTDYVDSVRIPHNKADKLSNIIKYNGSDSIIGSKWDKRDPSDTDNLIYWFESKQYPRVSKRIHTGDLIELSILYKYIDNNRTPIHWISNGEESNLICEGIPDNSNLDPLIYYTNYSENFCKLKYIEYDQDDGVKSEVPITLDGYVITWGELSEFSRVIRFKFEVGSIYIGDDFIIQLSEDSINVFSISKYIQEYFISSCKVLTEGNHYYPDVPILPDEPIIPVYTVSVRAIPTDAIVSIYTVNEVGEETLVISDYYECNLEVDEGTDIHITVKHPDYNMISRYMTVTENLDLDFDMGYPLTYTVRVTPDPTDANVVIYRNGVVAYRGIGDSTITVIQGETIRVEVDKHYYNTYFTEWSGNSHDVFLQVNLTKATVYSLDYLAVHNMRVLDASGSPIEVSDYPIPVTLTDLITGDVLVGETGTSVDSTNYKVVAGHRIKAEFNKTGIQPTEVEMVINKTESIVQTLEDSFEFGITINSNTEYESVTLYGILGDGSLVIVSNMPDSNGYYSGRNVITNVGFIYGYLFEVVPLNKGEYLTYRSERYNIDRTTFFTEHDVIMPYRVEFLISGSDNCDGILTCSVIDNNVDHVILNNAYNLSQMHPINLDLSEYYMKGITQLRLQFVPIGDYVTEYYPFEKVCQLNPGVDTVQGVIELVEMEDPIKYFNVSINSTPDTSSITIYNGNEVLRNGIGTLSLSVEEGTIIRLEITNDKYTPYSESIEVTQDITRSIELVSPSKVTSDGTPIMCEGIPVEGDTDPYVYYFNEE